MTAIERDFLHGLFIDDLTDSNGGCIDEGRSTFDLDGFACGFKRQGDR